MGLLLKYSRFTATWELFSGAYEDGYGRADEVTIAKVDGTANELPFKIIGYPQIMLFPANSKDEPTEYVVQDLGLSTAKLLAEFIQKIGSHNLPVPDALQEVDQRAAAPKVEALRDEL